MEFIPFTQNIGTAGSRVQINNSALKVKVFHIHALAANAGLVYFGDVLVSSSASGRALSADQSVTVEFGQGSVPLSTFYVDTATNNDDVDGWALVE